MGRRDLESYSPEKWAQFCYLGMRERRRWQTADAVTRCLELRALFLPAYHIAAITAYGLDNPFASNDARAVMQNDCDRMDGFK